MEKVLKYFEKYMSYALIITAMMLVVYQTINLFWLFGSKLYYNYVHRSFELETPGRPVAGLFFTILLIMEIIETIKVFAQDHVVKIRIILLVGLIAVTRKLLMADMSEGDPNEELAIAALIIALSVGYYLTSRSGMLTRKEEKGQ